jgi:hypothetical protein
MKTCFAAVSVLLLAALPLFAQDTPGSWSTSLQQDTELTATTVAPLGKDMSLNCNRNVIPVKFTLGSETEELVLSSNTGDSDPANDFSTLSFDPAETLTVADLTNLTAVYDVLAGNCGGGSLRWEIDTTAGNVFVYYGTFPNFTDCDGAESQSGVNLLSLDDARVDSSQVQAGTQYNTWNAFVAAFGTLVVEDVRLVTDGGWSQAGGLQSFDIAAASVNDNTFDGTGGSTSVCDLPDATIRLTRADGTLVTAQSVQAGDDDLAFREDDCQYIYNLVNPGAGTYTVEILVDGEVVGSATFTVACKK